MQRFLSLLTFLVCIYGGCTIECAEKEALRTFYAPIEAYQTGFLQVDEEHNLYWEESGNPDGKPILFIHGGPGIGTHPNNRRFFDPAHYRIILFDQRGCGKSTPFSSLNNNTTWHLVEDIEKLRQHLKLDEWVLFGGSWGSTLALSYAIKHPECVSGMILRGIYLCRPKDISWYYQEGVSQLFPDVWENYIAPIPPDERHDFVSAFYKRLTSSDSNERKAAAISWSGWEGATSKLEFDPALYASFTQDDSADAIARIECHYFIHNTFFDSDNWILENLQPIKHIPCEIVHGRYDMPCLFEGAWQLSQLLPESTLHIIPNAGHASTEPGILDALIKATDAFRGL